MSIIIAINEIVMVTWNDYKAQAKARGALVLEFYDVQSSSTNALEDVQANLLHHLAHQAGPEKIGKLVFSRPMSDESG